MPKLESDQGALGEIVARFFDAFDILVHYNLSTFSGTEDSPALLTSSTVLGVRRTGRIEAPAVQSNMAGRAAADAKSRKDQEGDLRLRPKLSPDTSLEIGPSKTTKRRVLLQLKLTNAQLIAAR